MRFIPVRCAFVLCFIPLACTPEPLEFADWTIPVPEGTRTIEYAAVPMEERTEVLALKRDLVLTGAFDRPFYRPHGLEVGPDGKVYVLDAGNHRVVAFSPGGHPLTSFGRQGEGPGEFQRLNEVAVLKDRVLIHDSRNSRFSLFAPDGEHELDRMLMPRLRTSGMRGKDDELILIEYEIAFMGEGPVPWVIGQYSLEGARLTTAVELTSEATAYWKSGIWEGSVPIRSVRPLGVIARDGTIYATAGDEYQCLSVNPEGDMNWALRVAFEPPALTAEQRQEVVKFLSVQLREMDANLSLTETDFTWPERHAALENLQVDGHGNLYLFPHSQRTPETVLRTDEPVPVDVYSPMGERLFSGRIDIEDWDSEIGEYLYRVETDPISEEHVVARYRLVEPY